jgi:hypothetical protein
MSIVGLGQCRRSPNELRGGGVAVAGIIVSSVFLLINLIAFAAIIAAGNN